jgi:hypothetical protein
MFVQVPMQTGYGQIALVEVSVPYVAALIADGGKYYMKPKRLDDATERRADVAVVSQAGSAMPIGRGIGPGAQTPLPAATGAPGNGTRLAPRRGRGRQTARQVAGVPGLMRPYTRSHHQSAKAMAVIEMEITTDVAINFAHSQYDTNAIPVGPMPR